MAFGSLGRFVSGLFGSNSGANASPLFPEIFIGEDFWPQVQASVDGIDRVAGSFRSFRVPLHTAVNTVITPSIRQNFEAEGRPAWQRLSTATLKYKKSDKILHASGKLKSVATSDSIWRYTDHEAHPAGMDIVRYAAYHQGGTQNMPQREFMVYQEQDIVAIEQIFVEWMALQADRHWR